MTWNSNLIFFQSELSRDTSDTRSSQAMLGDQFVTRPCPGDLSLRMGDQSEQSRDYTKVQKDEMYKMRSFLLRGDLMIAVDKVV